jgi:Transposase DDE domain
MRKDLLIRHTRRLLREFVAPMLEVVDKPRKRFLPQVLRGILFSGSLVVVDLGRWVRDDCSDSFYRLKRLLNHLASPRGDLKAAVRRYRQAVAGHIAPDTALILDLTDLAKPRARRMAYLDLVRDGSEGQLVKGYWCIEVYAYLPHKRVLPLALEVYGSPDPAVGSENLQIERVVTAVHEDLQGQGLWVADAGLDRLEAYEMWFSLHAQFLVRQRGDRTIVTPSGTPMILRDFVEHLYQRGAHEVGNQRIVFGRVHLPDYPDQPLYAVASWWLGAEEPMILLTTQVVETLDQARQALRYYKQRWACEEAAQFLKSRVGLERFRVRRYEAMRRLAILAMFAMGFLTWILLRSRDLTKRLLAWTSRFRRPCPFLYYRLLDGLQEFVRLHPRALTRLPPKSRQNG